MTQEERDPMIYQHWDLAFFLSLPPEFIAVISPKKVTLRSPTGIEVTLTSAAGTKGPRPRLNTYLEEVPQIHNNNFSVQHLCHYICQNKSLSKYPNTSVPVWLHTHIRSAMGPLPWRKINAHVYIYTTQPTGGQGTRRPKYKVAYQKNKNTWKAYSLHHFKTNSLTPIMMDGNYIEDSDVQEAIDKTSLYITNTNLTPIVPGEQHDPKTNPVIVLLNQTLCYAI